MGAEQARGRMGAAVPVGSAGTAVTVVAHRGVADRAPENTLPALRRALAVGADAAELDVRLTRDGVPVVFHYYYLDEVTELAGPIYAHTAAELARAGVRSPAGGAPGAPPADWRIPTLDEVLAELGGRLALEIEVKGPEPESVAAVAAVLDRHRAAWDRLEVTSYEPALLLALRERCPGLAVDLLMRPSPDWMGPDVLAYEAAQRGRLAGARAVHLHPAQLSPAVVAAVREHGLGIHVWDVNDAATLARVAALGLTRVCSDRVPALLAALGRSVPPRGPGEGGADVPDPE